MSSQLTSSSRKGRLPKPGTGFLLVRMTGWIFKILGGLLIAAALLGFAIGLLKVGTTLSERWDLSKKRWPVSSLSRY